MPYYYEDPGYAEYGNHGDDEYDKYGSYLDYAEPDQYEHEDQYHNDTNQEYAPQEFEQGQAEHKVQELEELEHTANGEEYEPEGLEHEGSEIYEHGELTYEPRYDTEAQYTAYEPHGFDHDDEQTGPVAFDNTPTSFKDAHGSTPTADDPITYAYPPPLSPSSTHGDHAPTYVPPIPPFSPMRAMSPTQTNEVT